MTNLSGIKALTFDLFGTVLDLGGSLSPAIGAFLKDKGAPVSAKLFWDHWRARQRLEQFQDTIMMLGHSGYLETSRRALTYVLRLNRIAYSADDVKQLMAAWQELSPFPDIRPALERLKTRFRLVALSNGEPEFLDHLVKNRIRFNFDDVLSVHMVGAFKPHPGVYRRAAGKLGLEVGECLMVSANSFDVVGARACGFRGIYIDRYRLPYEDTCYQPDLVVANFTELAEALLIKS